MKNRHKATAKRLLVHYFDHLLDQAGTPAESRAECVAEISEAIDELIAAARRLTRRFSNGI